MLFQRIPVIYCHHCPLVVISRCSNMARLLLVCAESLILIHPLIPLTQLQQLPKQTQTWLVQPVSIHLLPIMLNPRVQSSFFQIIFGKIPSVHFYEGLYLMEVRHPSLVLCHTIILFCPLCRRHRRRLSTANILKIPFSPKPNDKNHTFPLLFLQKRARGRSIP